MSKRKGYVYQRAGRSSAQVTGAGVQSNPKAFAEHGRTPVERARGRMMLDARSKGWSTDPSELPEETQIYSKGESLDIEVTVSGGRATGTIVSRKKKYLPAGANEVRLDFDPRRAIPSPAQAEAAVARRAARRQAVTA